MRAVVVEGFGGPEVLRVVDDAPDPVAADGHLVIDVTRAGVNFADTHQVEDSYLAPTTLPFVPGAEVAGTTSDGRRVVALVSGGGYAERARAASALTFPLDDALDDGDALALVLQGTTAWHLLRTSAHLAPGESVAVHAAAGGVGILAVQLARLWGAGRIVAVASSADKRELALAHGADAAVDAAEEDLTGALVEAGGGRLDVVLEMTGGATTDASLEALAPFGRLVVYGMASRQAPTPIVPGALMARSRGVIGFWLAHALRDPARHMVAPFAELSDLVTSGALTCVIGGTYAMSDVRRAHEDLRARRTVGKVLLDPSR